MRKIEKNQIVEALKRSNLWWNNPKQSFFNELPKRTHFANILTLVQQKNPNRALVLMGPRRVGKTVIIYQVINNLLSIVEMNKKILYASLDNPLFRLSSLEEIMQWGLETINSSLEEAFIFFDEVQYVENWEQQLKVLVDNYPKLKFVVTGSATAVLHKKSKESGAGRFTDYMLPPLSFFEFMTMKAQLDAIPKRSIDLAKLNNLYIDYLNYGGFPESFTSQNVRDFPEQYIGQDILDKVLLRDLPSVFGITNPNELLRLFTALAYNSSNEISLESITKTSGVSKKDIYRYIDYLEAAFLIKTIDKTDKKNQNFQRRTFFKVILSNPSLRSAIFGKIKDEDSELEGLAETAIFSQLIIHFWHFELYKYARWNRGKSRGEVDLVHVDKKGTPLVALEIKWTDRYALGNEDPKSLITFCRENNLKEGYVTSKTIFATRIYGDITIKFIPTSYMCLLIGYTSSINDIAKKLRENTLEQINKTSNINGISEDQLKLVEQIIENMFFLKENLIYEHFNESLKLAEALLK